MNTPPAEEEIEEERRLFYVGITRTKQQLNLVVPLDEGLARWLKTAGIAPEEVTDSYSLRL